MKKQYNYLEKYFWPIASVVLLCCLWLFIAYPKKQDIIFQMPFDRKKWLIHEKRSLMLDDLKSLLSSMKYKKEVINLLGEPDSIGSCGNYWDKNDSTISYLVGYDVAPVSIDIFFSKDSIIHKVDVCTAD